jgi:hypothetical protein
MLGVVESGLSLQVIELAQAFGWAGPGGRTVATACGRHSTDGG